jgi:transcription initiation factor TFIIIB Brf1 subunit/transcription initiation factor TFIIB
VTRSGDVIHRLLNEFNVSDKRAVRMKRLKLSTRIEKCVWLMGKTPTSIAAVIILKTLGEYTTKHEVCDKCGVSLPTLNKIEAIMNKYLEGLVE